MLLQSPELPTGCEITAMTMALRYAGLDADKVTMATEYLPCQPYKLYTGADGKTYGPDWNHYFIGDPTTEIGYVCGTGAILTAANRYLEDVGNPLRAKDRTGARPEELYALVSQDIPVVVWVTIRMGFGRRRAAGIPRRGSIWTGARSIMPRCLSGIPRTRSSLPIRSPDGRRIPAAGSRGSSLPGITAA